MGAGHKIHFHQRLSRLYLVARIMYKGETAWVTYILPVAYVKGRAWAPFLFGHFLLPELACLSLGLLNLDFTWTSKTFILLGLTASNGTIDSLISNEDIYLDFVED